MAKINSTITIEVSPEAKKLLEKLTLLLEKALDEIERQKVPDTRTR